MKELKCVLDVEYCMIKWDCIELLKKLKYGLSLYINNASIIHSVQLISFNNKNSVLNIVDKNEKVDLQKYLYMYINY